MDLMCGVFFCEDWGLKLDSRKYPCSAVGRLVVRARTLGFVMVCWYPTRIATRISCGKAKSGSNFDWYE